MRLLTLSILFSAIVPATGQPVLQYADVDLIGKTFTISVVTDPGSSDPNIDGANVTWDFSSATVSLGGSVTFVDPASTPYAASYPASNLAQAITVSGNTTYNYLLLSSTQLDVLAEDVGSGDETIYTDPKTPLQFPFGYPDYFIDYFAYDGTNYSVSRAYMGYGTVILPTGTYTNVVKMASTSGSIDFFRSDPLEPLVGINDDGTVLVWGDAQVGLPEAMASLRPVVYPNPATDVVRITGLAGAGTWELVDAQGRVLQSDRHVSGTLVLDLASLVPGFYHFVANDALGCRSARVVKH